METFPLSSLNEGRQGRVVKILSCAEDECGFRKGARGKGCLPGSGHGMARVIDLGIREGKIVELLHKGRQGPMLVKVDEARIAIGRGMAEKIMVAEA